MRRLKIRTRLGVSPSKKQKVYFCSHRDDFEKYFEKISEEILSFQDCAICYSDDYDEEYDEDFYLGLKQMNLFVIPVTTKFLCEKNEAYDVEFRFAVENNIPVLPLMQESGLENLFNIRCGNLQFLDRLLNDPTALSYSKKLEEYLESVLVGDELAKRVRDEFDAYIFLSYRKKDRKYAHELMRAIHKNDICRDIAIWYDEFLVPGEDFNESIKSALDKSVGFVLAVTPNIVNEENYIMNIEYPMAKKQKKNIIPAEMIPTERKLLKKKYRRIPKCIDVRGEGFSETVFKSIKKAIVREHGNSPEHKYYIGIAYLNGIDVEIDFQRAQRLIISSAEDGFTDAIKKIIDMYIKGAGVPRDFEKAILWQKKYIELLKNEHIESSKEESCVRWLNEKISLADMLRGINKNDEAKEVLSECLSECEKLVSENEREEVFYLISSACDSLYGIYNSEGDAASAGKTLRRMAALYGNAMQNNVDGRQLLEVEYMLALSEAMLNLSMEVSLNLLGGLDEEKSPEPSKKMKIAEQIYEQYGDGAGRLASEYFSYAKELEKADMNEQADVYFTKALTLREQVVKDNAAVQNIRKLCEIYSALSEFYEKKKEKEKAKEFAVEAYDLYEKLSEDTRSPEDYATEREKFFKFVSMGYMDADDEKVKSLFRKEIERRKEFSVYTGNIKEYCLLFNLLNSFGLFLERKGCLKEAEECYGEALLMTQTIQEDKLFSDRVNFIDKCFSDFAPGYTLDEETALAAEYYCKILGIRKKYAEDVKEEVCSRLYDDYSKAGHYIFGDKNPLKKAEYLGVALEIDLIELKGKETMKSIEDQEEYGCYTAFEKISKIYEQEKEYTKAKEYLIKYKKFVEENARKDKSELLSDLNYEIAELCKKSENYSSAVEYYKMALGDKGKPVDELSGEESKLWGYIYSGLAKCYNQMNDIEKARRSYELLADIYLQKIKSYATSHILDHDEKEEARNYFDYATARFFLAQISEKETKTQLLEEAIKVLKLYKKDAGDMEALFDAYISLSEEEMKKD